MAKSLIFLGFLFAVDVPLVRPAGKSDDYDIYLFLNGTSKLWVYNSTENGTVDNVICRYDIKVNITQNETFFYRTADGKPKRAKELLKGVFEKWNAEDEVLNAMAVINVGDDIGATYRYEVLEYANVTTGCAVVSTMDYDKVKGKPVMEREMWLSESALSDVPDLNCSKKFDDILKIVTRKAASHYSSSCMQPLMVH